MKIKEEIFILIGAYLEGTPLSDEEKKKLENWLSVSSSNRSIFEKCEDLFLSGQDLKFLDEVDIDEAWNKLENQIAEKSIPLRYKFLKYAAIILPILGISAFLFFSLGKMEESGANYSSLDSVYAGKAQAQLTLASGETINLGKINKIVTQTANLIIQSDSLGNLEYKSKGVIQAEYNSLYVPRAGEYKLILADGTKVWLNSDSKLRYPTAFTGKDRKVYLEGEAYFEVAKYKDKPFIVSSNNMDIQVLGTKFNISSYQDAKETELVLVEGSVSYIAGKYKGLLSPGEKVSYNIVKEELSIRKVDVEKYISWKKGIFTFNKIRLEDLGVRISRWYDVEVIFMNTSVKEQLFTGAIEKDKSLKFLIEILEATNSVSCESKENVLYIE